MYLICALSPVAMNRLCTELKAAAATAEAEVLSSPPPASPSSRPGERDENEANAPAPTASAAATTTEKDSTAKTTDSCSSSSSSSAQGGLSAVAHGAADPTRDRALMAARCTGAHKLQRALPVASMRADFASIVSDLHRRAAQLASTAASPPAAGAIRVLCGNDASAAGSSGGVFSLAVGTTVFGSGDLVTVFSVRGCPHIHHTHYPLPSP